MPLLLIIIMIWLICAYIAHVCIIYLTEGIGWPPIVCLIGGPVLLIFCLVTFIVNAIGRVSR